MNYQKAIDEISASLGPPKPRAGFGQWMPLAWLVRGLVERGHNVTNAVNAVLDQTKLPVNISSFGSLRAAFYRVKDQPWPAQPEPETTEFE